MRQMSLFPNFSWILITPIMYVNEIGFVLAHAVSLKLCLQECGGSILYVFYQDLAVKIGDDMCRVIYI